MIDIRLGRYFLDEKYVQELILIHRQYPDAFDEVWFATEYGFPLLDKHKESAGKMVELAKIFRANNKKVSLQISNTLGHGEYLKETDNDAIMAYNLEKMVGHDGTVADYCFCYRGDSFRQHSFETAKVYAKVFPECVWIDDDLRAYNHSPVAYACYCDNCINLFNEKHKSSFTRDSLVREINYGGVYWREQYIQFIRNGIYDYTYALTKAVMEVSPDSVMGYQYARASNYLGKDYRFVLDALKEGSGKAPKSRPGGGFYNDKYPLDMLGKAIMHNCSNSVLPEYVIENYSEIENTPDVAFGKSVDGTCIEASLTLAFGCTGLTFATLMVAHEPLSWHKNMLRQFSEYRGYWNRLIAHNRNKKSGGVCVFESPVSHKRTLTKNDLPFSWEKIAGHFGTELLQIGVPVSHDKEVAKAFILTRVAIDYMTNTDIHHLIHKPVVTDATVLAKIIDRGFGLHFKVEIHSLDRYVTEVFTDCDINSGYQGMEWNESYFFSKYKDKYVIEGEELLSVGNYREKNTGEALGCANAIIHTYDSRGKQLSKWAVFGYSLWNDVISSAKRQQILRSIDYISDNTLPAVLQSPEQVAVIPRIDTNGKTVSVTLQNLSIGKTQPMQLLIRNPKGDTFEMQNAYKKERVAYKKQKSGYWATIPSLFGWEIITVFIF